MSDEKKHKSGFTLLKEKYAKLEKERDEWKKDAEDKQVTIKKQGTKISQQAKELNDAAGKIYYTTRQRDEAIRRMGTLRRWWYGYKYPHSASDGNVELK